MKLLTTSVAVMLRAGCTGPESDPVSTMNKPPVEIADGSAVFRAAWALYEKLVTHNDMRHREVYGELQHIVRERFVTADGTLTPYRLADLGCGDGAWTAAAVSDHPPTDYLAVDLVELLVQAACERFRNLGACTEGWPLHLVEAAARVPVKPFDLILASYSMHHLQTGEKRSMYRNLAGWMAEDATLVVIDVARGNGESRRDWLDRFHAVAQSEFTTLTDSDREAIRTHMEQCDFPETVSVLSELAVEARLSTRVRYRDPHRFYVVLEHGRE